MARISLKATLGQGYTANRDGRTSVTIGGSGAPVTTLSTTTYDSDATTVAADIATLVADGASPTQGHVNTLNTDYTALAAAYTALKAQITAVSAETGDLYVSIDTTKITNGNQLKSALDAVYKAFRGMSQFADASSVL